MIEHERCQAPDADGRWCEFTLIKGELRCIRCNQPLTPPKDDRP